MTEQELVQENEKLKARLQKAITVFGEQKANIARLTEERDSARAEQTKLEERIKALEEVSRANEENDTKFFDQLQEIESLNEQLNSAKEENQGLQADLASSENLLKETRNAGKDLLQKYKMMSDKLQVIIMRDIIGEIAQG